MCASRRIIRNGFATLTVNENSVGLHFSWVLVSEFTRERPNTKKTGVLADRQAPAYEAYKRPGFVELTRLGLAANESNFPNHMMAKGLNCARNNHPALHLPG